MKSTEEHCKLYCGLTCVNGNCPNALNDLDRNSDDDRYAAHHLDKKLSCKDCFYYKGCEDCYFSGTPHCIKEH